jgi:hypothetical protein
LSLTNFLATVVRLLEDAGIPYMLTGSLAAAFYAAPRATQDVDLVIEATDRQIDVLLDGLLAEGLYVSKEAAHEAFRAAGQFNVVDPETGWKADLIVRRNRPFSLEEFGRRRSARLLGVEVALTSLEDLVIAKLEWSTLGDSELQRRDLATLIDASGATLDRTYVEHWVDELGLETAWRDLLNRTNDGVREL